MGQDDGLKARGLCRDSEAHGGRHGDRYLSTNRSFSLSPSVRKTTTQQRATGTELGTDTKPTLEVAGVPSLPRGEPRAASVPSLPRAENVPSLPRAAGVPSLPRGAPRAAIVPSLPRAASVPSLPRAEPLARSERPLCSSCGSSSSLWSTDTAWAPAWGGTSLLGGVARVPYSGTRGSANLPDTAL